MPPKSVTPTPRNLSHWLFACLLLLIAPFAQAAFTINNDGTVTDPTTGLTWMRCSVGQTWDGSTCSGEPSYYTFDPANSETGYPFDQAKALTGTVTFAGQSDWRLPNIRELQTIVDRYRSAIDRSAFPNTQGLYLSGSSYAINSEYTWGVDFDDGQSIGNGRWVPTGTVYAVRLVRGGQPFGPLLGITRPTSDYVDHGNGTVTHTPTNLMWKRCAQGQNWTGSTCSGEARAYTFDQANALTGTTTFAGLSDWRLPTVDELLSLVDFSKSYPSINTEIFPAVPSEAFWSGSVYAANPNPWLVGFRDGEAGAGDRNLAHGVWLVRSSTKPVCTITATPVVIASGGSATLKVGCTPAASSYTWSVTDLSKNTTSTSVLALTLANDSVTVKPTVPTQYSVVGKNDNGESAAAKASVYVCNTPPYQDYPGLSFTGDATSQQIADTIGNDVIDGGFGIDTVLYNCNRTNFIVNKTASGWGVSSLADGLDILTNVERLQFDDMTLALDITGNAGQAYRLYQAAFNRAPDGGGLKYWIGRMDAGTTLEQAAAGFIDSAEFKNLYGANPNNEDFVIKLYSNVLHRAPDAGGKAYWLDQLNNGMSKTAVLMAFSESPENQAGVLNAIMYGIELPK